MAAKKITVICLQDRQIADDLYVAGSTYKIDADRADRYSEYFKVIPTPLKPKKAKKVESKNAGATEDK
tara:strand:+ start:190 stop:393 length:204 start_codon:yes stop_codon:yes gene_type:complete